MLSLIISLHRRAISGRCVMKINVLPAAWAVSRSISRSSVSASSAELNSSSSRMRPGHSSPRAMAMRCACPSLSPAPPSPQGVSRPWGRVCTKSAAAVCNASCSCPAVAAGLPSSRLARIVPLNKLLPCGTNTKAPRVAAEASAVGPPSL